MGVRPDVQLVGDPGTFVQGLALAADWLAEAVEPVEPPAALWDQIKMAVPGIGKVTQKYATARFCRSLGALYGGGILLQRAVEVSARACGSQYIEETMLRNLPMLASGGGISAMLEMRFHGIGQVMNVDHDLADARRLQPIEHMVEQRALAGQQEIAPPVWPEQHRPDGMHAVTRHYSVRHMGKVGKHRMVGSKHDIGKHRQLGVFGGKYMTDCRREFPRSWFTHAKLCAERHDPRGALRCAACSPNLARSTLSTPMADSTGSATDQACA